MPLPNAKTHAHRWILDSHNVGTCDVCGEVRQYPWDGRGPVVVLRKGAAMPKGRLTKIQKRELLEIGPKAFGAKHGYRSTATLSWVYNRLMAAQTAPEPETAGAASTGVAGAAAVALPRVAAADLYLVPLENPPRYALRLPAPLPTAILAFLTALPKAGDTPTPERREQLKVYAAAAIDLVYGDQTAATVTSSLPAQSSSTGCAPQ